MPSWGELDGSPIWLFLGWIFTSVALALAALGAWLVYKHAAAPMTDAEFLFVAAMFVAGGIVWLLGRGVRFVLAGPKHDAKYLANSSKSLPTPAFRFESR